MLYRSHHRNFLPLLLLTTGLVACSQQPSDTAAHTVTSGKASSSASATATVDDAAAERIAGLDSEALSEAASLALRENRMYAPAGDNAIEYYLALRTQSPKDTYVHGALVDLLPYTVTAAENHLARENFEEADRLIALVEKINAQAPALPRLKQGSVDGRNIVARRSESEAAKAKLDAENRIKQQAEQQRLAQQRATEAEAAKALAAQQEAARQEAQRQQAALASQQEAARAAAAAAAPAAAAPRAVASTPTIRAVRTPPPRYPAEALRSGTEGEVLMELTISTDGSVSNARVLRAEPARIFDREALNAVRRWKYEPIDSPTTIRRTLAFKADK